MPQSSFILRQLYPGLCGWVHGVAANPKRMPLVWVSALRFSFACWSKYYFGGFSCSAKNKMMGENTESLKYWHSVHTKDLHNISFQLHQYKSAQHKPSKRKRALIHVENSMPFMLSPYSSWLWANHIILFLFIDMWYLLFLSAWSRLRRF